MGLITTVSPIDFVWTFAGGVLTGAFFMGIVVRKWHHWRQSKTK